MTEAYPCTTRAGARSAWPRCGPAATWRAGGEAVRPAPGRSGRTRRSCGTPSAESLRRPRHPLEELRRSLPQASDVPLPERFVVRHAGDAIRRFSPPARGNGAHARGPCGSCAREVDPAVRGRYGRLVAHTDVGVISDTHGLVRPDALDALAGAGAIVHAGDVGSSAVLDALVAIAPVTAVRGNNDHGPWADALAETATVE